MVRGSDTRLVCVGKMAPPESTTNFDSAPAQGDFDRSNYLGKIKDYVRKVEAFQLTPRQQDVKGLR